jgi:hypothetical protein
MKGTAGILCAHEHSHSCVLPRLDTPCRGTTNERPPHARQVIENHAAVLHELEEEELEPPLYMLDLHVKDALEANLIEVVNTGLFCHSFICFKPCCNVSCALLGSHCITRGSRNRHDWHLTRRHEEVLTHDAGPRHGDR